MTAGLINRWIVEQEPERWLDPQKPEQAVAGSVFEGPDAENRARAHQATLTKLGLDSQLYHERHVLIREPACWIPGDRTATPRPIRKTSADDMIDTIVAIAAAGAGASPPTE